MQRAEQVTLPIEDRRRGGFIEEEIFEPCCKLFLWGINGTDSWGMHKQSDETW